MEDKIIICEDCGEEFTFSVAEQEFFAQKGWTRDPKRCKQCRLDKKEQHDSRQMYDAVCSECGKPCRVPFEPKTDRPIYCASCYSSRK